MKNLNKNILLALIIICFIGLIYGTYNFLYWYISNKENSKIENDLKNVINEETITDEENNIDFEYLKEMNPDVVAYLKVNNTKINYVVVKANDNDYYLSHNFNKEPNVAGWVFADYNNKYDGNDKNLVIYGHNMRNGSMFGTLKNVLKKSWYENEDNHKILLIDENGTHTYQVFSTYLIEAEDYYINTDFKNDDEYNSFITKIASRSNYNYNVDLKDTNTVLTLSTCSSGGRKRVVLHAKLVN